MAAAHVFQVHELASIIIEHVKSEKLSSFVQLAGVNKMLKVYVEEMLAKEPPRGALPYILSRLGEYEVSAVCAPIHLLLNYTR